MSAHAHERKTEAQPSSSTDVSDATTSAWSALRASALAISAMTVIAVVNTQLTALFLFSNTAEIAIAYSFWSCIVSPAVVAPVFLFKPQWLTVPTREQRGDFALTCFCVFLDLAGANIALASISTALEQVIIASKPFVTIAIESLVHRRLDHWLMYAVVACLVAGSALTSVTTEFVSNPVGVAASIVSVVGSASKYVFTRRLVGSGSDCMHPTGLLVLCDLTIALPFLIWAAAAAQLPNFFGPSVLGASASMATQATATAALGGIKSVSQFLVLVYVTATSLSVSYVIAPTVNILLSLLVTQTDAAGAISPAAVAGIAVISACNLAYMVLRVDPRALPAVDRTLGCEGQQGKDEGSRPAREDTPLRTDKV